MSNRPEKKQKRSVNAAAVLLVVLIIFLAGINIWLYNGILQSGGKAFKESYETAREEEEKIIYDKFYEAAFNQYRTRNDISINIGNTQEEGKLEVLTVSDVVYIIQEADRENEGTSSWLEVPGKGVFTVDIRACEFITDHQRNTIKARIPRPEFTRFSIDYENVNLLSFSKTLTNGSQQKGEDLARKQLQEGDLRIRESIASNQKFSVNASSAAEKMVKQMLISLNPFEDINVEVEFLD